MRDLQVTTIEYILVINNGCDRTIIKNNSFLIHTFTGTTCKINDAFNTMSRPTLKLVSNAYNLVTINETRKYISSTNMFLIRFRCNMNYYYNLIE